MANSSFIIPQANTDFNVSPYYDDFTPSKNYKRILAIPTLALQARDIIQMQSMIQFDQAVYMSHIFREGSKIKGGDFKLDLSANYLRLQDQNSFGNTINLNNFSNTVITGSTSGVTAFVLDEVSR